MRVQHRAAGEGDTTGNAFCPVGGNSGHGTAWVKTGSAQQALHIGVFRPAGKNPRGFAASMAYRIANRRPNASSPKPGLPIQRKSPSEVLKSNGFATIAWLVLMGDATGLVVVSCSKLN